MQEKDDFCLETGTERQSVYKLIKQLSVDLFDPYTAAAADHTGQGYADWLPLIAYY